MNKITNLFQGIEMKLDDIEELVDELEEDLTKQVMMNQLMVLER